MIDAPLLNEMSLSRDEGRAALARSGIDIGEFGRPEFSRLRELVDEECRRSGAARASLRVSRMTSKDTPRGRVVRILCRSDYFKDREAFTFNPDGFVGIAGWADETSVQPFLKALVAWVRELAPEPEMVSESGRDAVPCP
ncbi:hypothetical protein LAZ40_03145 [Cereibacter sphaeroides]|uniref:hypothetical protein n=1 Tax=Cereibacter sphaeroides TaxID=1063 RepID=UPI001F358713|nr:hypothetical protein [Cereibacter sphaeroides]MCE6958051.1 hypothetical protein [Cereibacter sphaeroides]MCE6971356.1 hypothetical protein [Cereibacter sphaeroides]